MGNSQIKITIVNDTGDTIKIVYCDSYYCKEVIIKHKEAAFFKKYLEVKFLCKILDDNGIRITKKHPYKFRDNKWKYIGNTPCLSKQGFYTVYK